jgi:hypothetical protein
LVERQAVDLVKRLQILPEWHELIQAYYLSDNVLSDFEREAYGLLKDMGRMKELFLAGHIDQLEINQEALRIGDQLRSLKVVVRPEEARILPMLRDWPFIWEKMNGLELNAVLDVIFSRIRTRKLNLPK